jgi:deoxyribodipyrimidine photo-lyase
MTKPVICWFRRDLRLKDNRALEAALKSDGLVIPVFIFDRAILESDRISLARLKFMLGALHSLDDTLKDHGRRLLVRHGEPLTVLQNLVDETQAAALYFNADYTPFAAKRDEKVREGLGVDVFSFDDRLLMPANSVLTNDERPYSIYSPFKRKWREKKSERPPIADYQISADRLLDLDNLQNDGVPSLKELGFANTIDIPIASEAKAQSMLDKWISNEIYNYADGRDMLGNPQTPPHTQTSFLSPYIRFGLISTRTIYWHCGDAYKNTQSKDKRKSVDKFIDEIIWHEFYTHILWHFPHVVTENFNDKYNRIQWEDAPEALDAWKTGVTGYPIVDAAMRQLNQTGWMHNRARMIVASFLTKDLLINWREGERYFMQRLIDGDLAANNGGWQWAASTGADAQPYFRVFNPVSQSKKFDPDGAFIRCWLPELCHVEDKYIHEPHLAPNPPESYPSPIVDHNAARKATLEAYEAVKGSG